MVYKNITAPTKKLTRNELKLSALKFSIPKTKYIWLMINPINANEIAKIIDTRIIVILMFFDLKEVNNISNLPLEKMHIIVIIALNVAK